MRFADVLEIRNGRNQRQVECPNGKYPIYGSGGVMGYANSYICEANTVVIGRKGNINNPIFVEEPFWNVDTAFGLIPHADVLIPKYLFYFCENYNFEKLNTTVTIPSLTKANLLQVEIDVPEIGIQKSRVGILDKIEHSCRLLQQEVLRLDQLVKSRFVEMFGDLLTKAKYPKRQISDLGIVGTGNTPSMRVSEYYESEDIPFIKPGDIAESGVTIVSNADTAYISESARKAARIMPYNTVMVTCIGTIGKVGIVQRESACNQQINYIIPNALINSMYLAQCLSFYKPVLEEMANAPVVPIINKTQFSTVALPVPPLELQNHFAAFVAEVDKSKFHIQKSLSTSRKLWTMAQIDAIMNMDFSTQRSL